MTAGAPFSAASSSNTAGMPQPIQFFAQGQPVKLVPFALNGFFGQQCRFQFGGLAQNSGRQQRADRRKLAAKPRVGLGQFHQYLRGAEFPRPEFHLRGIRPVTMLKIVRFDQAPDHRPVLVALGFLRLHQVGQRKHACPPMGRARTRCARIEERTLRIGFGIK